jgi:hypothetical protein
VGDRNRTKVSGWVNIHFATKTHKHEIPKEICDAEEYISTEEEVCLCGEGDFARVQDLEINTNEYSAHPN